MTYFGFLALFLVLPIAILLGLLALRHRRGATLPRRLAAVPPPFAIAVTAVVAIAYTTPWDNYLVATDVWSYNASLVSGIILGYVPLEEYLFFILQTVLTSLWFLFLAGRPAASGDSRRAPARARLWAALPVLLLWLAACAVLGSGPGPARYLALLLAWALPPILIQLAYGADLLWKERLIALPAILAATLCYAAADVIAVSAGTWNFNPDLIFGLHLGPLPIEEGLFFLLTNVLIVFSTTLLISQASMARFRRLVRQVSAERPPDEASEALVDGMT